MAGSSEQFQQSDVTVWGIAALVCGAIAVLGANISALVPDAALTALHLPMNDGVSLTQLRQQIAELRTETVQLRRQNEILTTRFSLQEQSGSEVTRRVGALEIAVPSMMEARLLAVPVDRSVTTASIGVTAAQQFQADGGSVTVRNSPMPQPLPAAIKPVETASGVDVGYAVAVGSNFSVGQGAAQWRALEVRLGSMVSEMSPLVTNGTTSGRQQLVIGPLAQMSEARDLCQRLEQMEISCMPTNYSGSAIAP